MATNANSCDCVGGVLVGQAAWSDAAPRNSGSAKRRADPKFGRAGHRRVLASQYFPGDLDLAESRDRGDEHSELRWAVAAPRNRAAWVRNGEGKFAAWG